MGCSLDASDYAHRIEKKNIAQGFSAMKDGPAPLVRSPGIDHFPKLIFYPNGRVKEARRAVWLSAIAIKRLLELQKDLETPPNKVSRTKSATV